VKQALTGKAIAVCYFLSKSLYLLGRAIQDNLDLTNHLQDAVSSLRFGFDKSVGIGETVRL